ncbi:MAG: hypothetical protein R2746_08930 [Acidimicrobiales bacterium]
MAWAAAATVAWRARHRDLNRLNLVLAVQSACATGRCGWTSDHYLYLVEWFWVLTGLIVLSVGWMRRSWPGTVDRRGQVDRRGPALAAVALLASTAAFTYSAARVDPPDQRYSETVGALVGPTTAALEPGRTYLVNWVDPDALGGNRPGHVPPARPGRLRRAPPRASRPRSSPSGGRRGSRRRRHHRGERRRQHRRRPGPSRGGGAGPHRPPPPCPAEALPQLQAPRPGPAAPSDGTIWPTRCRRSGWP